MRQFKLSSISTLLQNLPELKGVFYKLRQLAAIDRVIVALLPANLAKHCVVANLRENGVLVLNTDSPAWKHQLTFLKLELLEKLRASSADLAGLSSITININYLRQELEAYLDQSKSTNIPKNSSKLTNLAISEKTAALINTLADQEVKDPRLADRLKKLVAKMRIEA